MDIMHQGIVFELYMGLVMNNDFLDQLHIKAHVHQPNLGNCLFLFLDAVFLFGSERLWST